jgi:predicted DNA-binding transcriptional regulator AlpA
MRVPKRDSVSIPKPEPRWARNAALARYLSVTIMTIWRWQRDPKLNFPQPISINDILRTDLNLIDEWMRKRVVNLVEKRAKAVASKRRSA